MPEQKSSSNAYLFVDGYKDPNDLIGGCGDKNSEARRHVQKSRRLRHFRAHKPAMLRNCRVRVEVSDRFCNSTLQSSRSDRKPVRSTDERSPEVTPVPRPASMDSFITFPAKNVSTIVHQIIDHGIHHFWPGLTPIRGIKNNAFNPLNQAYLQMISSSQLAFHAYTMAILGNYLSLVGLQAIKKAHTDLILLHRATTLRLINDEISHLSGPPSDELIGAILVMAAADPDNLIRGSLAQKSRFRSPLAQAQLLAVMGAHPVVREHVLALTRLIPLKGGWKHFRAFKLAEVCEAVDLISSSGSSSKPVFPPIDRTRSVLLASEHAKDDNAKVFSSKLGIALIDMPFHEKQPSMINVIVAMKQVTIAVEHYCRGGKGAPDIADITQARNATQYALLSLSASPGYMSAEDAYLYRIYRQCLLIYSNIVIFPLPPLSGVETRLAVALKALLADGYEIYQTAKPTTASRLILWALVLGGISDWKDTERPWFLDRYTLLSTDLGIITWRQLENCLTSFLWLDTTLNKEAVRFWTDSRTKLLDDQTSGAGNDTVAAFEQPELEADIGI